MHNESALIGILINILEDHSAFASDDEYWTIEQRDLELLASIFIGLCALTEPMGMLYMNSHAQTENDQPHAGCGGPEDPRLTCHHGEVLEG